jgi:hypothetical protein
MDQITYDRALAHFAAKLLVQAEDQPKHVRDHLRTVAAELQVASVGS